METGALPVFPPWGLQSDACGYCTSPDTGPPRVLGHMFFPWVHVKHSVASGGRWLGSHPGSTWELGPF